MLLQIFAQPALAVQNNDKEGETKSTLSETHLKESKSIIETDSTDKEDDLKDKLSPLEYFYAQNLENNSIKLLNGHSILNSKDGFDIKDYSFLAKDKEGKLSVLKGEDIQSETTLDTKEFEEVLKEYKVQKQKLEEEKAGLDGLKPVETTITVSYKDFEKLYLPIVIDDSTGNIESTKDNLLSLYSGQENKGKEVLWTQTFILDNLQNLEELKVNFVSQNDNLKDLKITSVTATDGEKEEELFKEEIKENKELKELDLTKEVKPGYKYEITLSSEIKDLQKDYGLTTELSNKSIDEKPLVEKFENVVKGKEEEKAEEVTKPTEEKSTESSKAEIEETKSTEETQIKEDEKPTPRGKMVEPSSETKIDSLLKRSRMSLLGASNGLEISEDLISPAVGFFFPYTNGILDVNIDQKVVEINDQENGGVNEYVDYIDWTFTVKYSDLNAYNAIHNTPNQRHLWHSFTTTGDSGLGTPQIISINRIDKSTGIATDLLNGSSYKNYVTPPYNDTGNDFQSITYRDGFPINNVDPTRYSEEIVVRTPVIRFQYFYNIDYHISANINKQTTDSNGISRPIGLQEIHQTKSIHKMEATTYRGEVIDTSYMYLDSNGNIMPTDTMNTVPTGDLAIARSVTGRYIAPNKIKWQVSDRNLTHKDINSFIEQNGLVDDTQTIESATVTLYKPENNFNNISGVGSKYTRSGQTSSYEQILKPGQIAYYEVITAVKPEKETVEHSFTTGKKQVEAKLNGIKKPIIINKLWDGVPANSRVDTKYKIIEDGNITEATITKDKTNYSSEPVLVYQNPLNTNGREDWTLNRTRPLKPLTREVAEDTEFLATTTGPNGEKYKLYNSSSNNEQNIYTFTNGFEKKAGSYGITKIYPMEQNQYELPAEPGRGRTYGWAGAVSGELKVPKGFKVGDYISLTISEKLTLAAVTDPNKPLFKITEKDTGEVLFNIYKVGDSELRFVATDYLEQKAKTRDVTANWMVGENWTINNNDTLINGSRVQQGTKIERGFSIDQDRALDYDDPNNIFKANNSGLNGVSNGIATFKSSLSTNPNEISDIQGDLKIHFEASFDEVLMKKFDNKVISDVNENGKRKITWRIVSNEGKYKLLFNGKQTDSRIIDKLSTKTDKTRLWVVGPGDQTLKSFRAGVATRANEIGGFDPSSFKSIPVYTREPMIRNSNSKYVLIQNLPTNPTEYNSTFTFIGKNLDPEDTLVIDFDVEFIHAGLAPERLGQINNQITINPRPSGGVLNLDSYYGTTRGSGTAAFDNTQSFEINKVTLSNGQEVPINTDFAEFVLYKVEGGTRNAVTRKSTDSTGKATFDNLTPGEYVLVESKAPDGYKISTAEYKIIVTDTEVIMNGQIGGSFNIINTKEEIPKYGEFTLTKVDSESKGKLPDAIFSITNSSGITSNFKTDGNGQIHFQNLKPGLYRLKELSAPKGYDLSTKEWSIYVNSEGRTFITELGEVAPNPGDIKGTDVSNRVKLTGTLNFNDNADGISGNNRLEMGSGENKITISMNLIVDGFVNLGDYFTIKESDTLHYNMLQPDKMNYPSIFDGSGNLLAYPTFGPNFKIETGAEKEIIYVFTDNVAGVENLNMAMEWGHSVNLNYASSTGSYDFSVSLGNNTIGKNISIAYKPVASNGNSNLDANYLYTNDQNGRYTQIGYINPKKNNLTGESLINIYPAVKDNTFNMADISSGKIKISLYKFNDGATVPNAVIYEKDKLSLVDPSNYTLTYTTKIENGVTVPLAQIKLNNIGTSTYFVMVESEMKFPEEGNNQSTILGQYIQLVNNGLAAARSSAIATNTSGGSGTGTGDYTPPSLTVENTKKIDKTGKFELIKTNEDGKEFLPGAEFTLKQVDSTGESIVKNSESDGKISFDNLKPGEYELTESKAPEGYIKSDKTWTVKVDSNGVTTVIEKVQAVGSAPSSFNSGSSSLGKLLMDVWAAPISLMALPTGTQESDITIGNVGTINYGNSKVTTSAKYLGNDEFEVKLDITAGQDIVENGPATDVVIVVQDPFLTPDVKNALINKINEYGDNVRVGVHFYNERTGYNGTARLMSKADAISAIQNGSSTSSYPNTSVRTQYALQTANNIFANGTSANKELIMIVGNSIGSSNAGITNQINNLNRKGVNINNFYVGSNSNLTIYLRNWDSLLGLSPGSTINASNNKAKALSDNLKVYGRVVKKAVENAVFNVSFNNDFTFVGGSTITTKPGPVSKWHSGYDSATNSIKLNAGELSLNAGETATMTFRVKSSTNVQTGKTYSLINPISYQPNSTVALRTIPSPTVTVAESNLSVTVNNSHTGGVPTDTSINFTLKRRVQNGAQYIEDGTFSKNGSIGVNGEQVFSGLPKKDASGNLYQYYVTDVKSTNDHVIATDYKATVSDKDGTITISTKENRGFNVSVDWQGLSPIGSIQGKASDGTTFTLSSDNKYFFEKLTAGAEKLTLDPNSITGIKGYTYTVIGGEGSYIIKVSKTEEVPSITVPNKKLSELLIIKTDGSGEEKLKGATFTLKDSTGKIITETTDDFGKLKFYGLKPGEYTLEETVAPVGYEKNNDTWKVIVGEDGKVSITPPGETKINTSYSISNKQGKRLYYTSVGYSYRLMDLQAKISQNSDSDSFNVKILYKGQDQYYNYLYNLEVIFDITNFTVTGNGISNGTFRKNIASGENNTNGEFNFTVTPKNPQDKITISPLKSVKYSNILLESSTYPTITPQIVEIKPDAIELSKTADNTFEYSIANELAKYEAEFIKLSRENPDDLSQDKPLENVEFSLYKKNEAGEFEDTTIKATSGSDGLIKLTDLEPGEYELHEDSTPEGYMPIEGVAKAFKMNPDGSIEVKGEDDIYKVIDDDNKKIINQKSGTEEFSLIKKDEAGKILEGVEFELRNSNGDVVATKKTDAFGKIVFDNLPYGKYWLKEIKTLDGYILDSKPIPVLLGKDWQVPENPESPRDVSNDLILDETKDNIIVSTENSKTVVYPNKAEGLMARVNFLVKEGTIINPGDTFTLKLSDNVNLDGLGIVDDETFDIMASSGKLAVAKIGQDRRSITYTFTDYVKYHKLNGFKINTPMFINRMVVKNNTKAVSMSIGIEDAVFSDTIDVSYENYVSDPERVKTYVTKFDDKTGEFTAIMYVNPQRDTDYYRWAEFWSDQLTKVTNIEMYSTVGGTQNLPWSYGVDFTKLNRLNNKFELDNYGHLRFYLGNDASNNAYVIKVEGVANTKGTEFITKSAYHRAYYAGYYDYYRNPVYNYFDDTWDTYLKFYTPDNTTDGEIVFNILNTKNKIKFTKVDPGTTTPPGQALPSSNMIPMASLSKSLGEVKHLYLPEQVKYLKDAVFQLKVKDGDTWKDYGAPVTSDDRGEFFWEGLPQGEYEVWETKAPEGYILPDKAVSSFKVDETGNIVDILNNTQIIPNERDKMKFYIDKIWKDEDNKEHRIEFGTLEFELKAPEGKIFPENVNVDSENAEVSDRKYKITNISEDKTTITLEMDLKTAYEGISSEEDVNKGIKINVPSDWPSGDYTLKETKAPAGFKIGTENYTININQTDRTIKSGETVLYSKNGESEILNPLKIVNERGKFPSTGGFGSLIFTILGLGVMATAFIGYRRKKVIR